jgi:hypothetical protein
MAPLSCFSELIVAGDDGFNKKLERIEVILGDIP